MKIKVANYTFDVVTKKVTLTDYASIRLDSLLLITNVTKNVIIYNFADTESGGTVSGNQITLIADLTDMSNSDKLQIFYETEDIPATDETVSSLADSVNLLKRIAKILEPISVQDSNNRQRVVIDSAAGVSVVALPTLSNVTTISTLTNLAGVGGVDPRFTFIEQAHMAYSLGIRANLSFT